MAKTGVPEVWAAIDDPFETEDEDLCPLCMEELDVSDLNFRPCPCGYRICRFCWHHIKEDLNGRCPGCRKQYDDSVVEFKPMKAEELKRLQRAKKQREKERKELELMNRKHLANVRVKQKNQVHIQGLTTKMANEDTMAQLKNSDIFTQFGRIQKMFMSRRTGATTLYTPDPRYQHVNLYINFYRNSEALACISGLDGTTLPDGHRIKAGLGTTKYCASFLRGVKCSNENCTAAHEPAEEVESNGVTAREEMSTARHAQKEAESRSSRYAPGPSTTSLPAVLPATASWANKAGSLSSQPSSPAIHNAAPPQLQHFHGRVGSPVSRPTHPLPPKPRQGSSVSSHPCPPSILSQKASDSAPGSTAPSVRSSPKRESPEAPTLSSASSPPPPLSPPESGPTTATTPPSRPTAAIVLPPDLTPASPVTSTVSGLPPGLPHPRPSSIVAEQLSSRASAIQGAGASLSSKGKQRATDPAMDDLLASFSATLSSLPHGDGTSDSMFSQPISGFGVSAFMVPPYSGSFDPFADAHIPPPPVDGYVNVLGADDVARRSSRFRFARGDSSSNLASGSSVSGSPARQGLAEPPGLERRDREFSESVASSSLAASPSSFNRTYNASETPASATPDASVLFPGVNLAASYSTNVLPAALAMKALKPDQPLAAFYPQPPVLAHEPATGPAQLQGIYALNRHMGAAGYGNAEASIREGRRDGLGDRPNGYFGAGQFGGEFQDPAIVSMRLTSGSSASYALPPPGLAAPDHTAYSQFPLAALSRGGYNQEYAHPYVRHSVPSRQWTNGGVSRGEPNFQSGIRLA